MYCKKCGFQINDEAVFCQKCSKKQTNNEENIKRESRTVQNRKKQFPEYKKSKT